jgi:Arc/MetJ-type ribon-helix-helix transcriptional regulator
MTVQIPVRIPVEDARALDQAVARGAFESRSDAVRRAIDLLLERLRDDEIAEQYRRAYTEHPQEDSFDGLLLFQARAEAEDDREPL